MSKTWQHRFLDEKLGQLGQPLLAELVQQARAEHPPRSARAIARNASEMTGEDVTEDAIHRWFGGEAWFNPLEAD